MKNKPVKPYMKDLPNVWLDHKYPPFTNTAVDYLGPIWIKQCQLRLKRWGCLFACMVTRAIPLEQAESMDTNSFINALQRLAEQANQTLSCQTMDQTSKVLSKNWNSNIAVSIKWK